MHIEISENIGRRKASTSLAKGGICDWRSQTDAPDIQPASEEPWEKQHTSPFIGNES